MMRHPTLLFVTTVVATLGFPTGGGARQGDLRPLRKQTPTVAVISSGHGAPQESLLTMGAGSALVNYGAPQIVLAGDADGDGRADFIGVDPQANTVDFGHMSALGKLNPVANARKQFGDHV